MTDEPLVLREDAEGIATLTLNRPDKRNAVNRALFREFRAHVEALDGDESIGLVILRGAGGGFCAGHDLKEPAHKDALGWLRRELLTLEHLTRLRQPVIAQVHGWCFTGGLEMALSADFIIAGESAQFADTHGKWGLVPGWGMSQRLPRRVGQARAMELMLSCRTVSGREAETIGLANRCVADAALDETVRDLARLILANSWHSNAQNKRLIYDTDGMTIGQGIVHEVMRNAGHDTQSAARKAGFGKG